MTKMQSGPLLGDRSPARFIVKVQRRALPPAPWGWAIYVEGEQHAHTRSDECYRCAEDAWQAGQLVRVRLGPAA